MVWPCTRWDRARGGRDFYCSADHWDGDGRIFCPCWILLDIRPTTTKQATTPLRFPKSLCPGPATCVATFPDHPTAHERAHDLEVQVALGPEIVVQQSAGDARLGRDLGGRDGRVAALGEQPPGAGQDLLAALVTL